MKSLLAELNMRYFNSANGLNKFFMTQKFKLVIDFPPLAGALLQGVICSWGLFIRIKFLKPVGGIKIAHI